MSAPDALSIIRGELDRRERLLTGLRELLDDVVGAVAPQLALTTGAQVVDAERVVRRRTKRRAGRVAKRRSAVRPGRRARRAPIAPGTIPARILEVLAEVGGAQRFDALVEAAKARPSQVREALNQLKAERRVVPVGRGRGTQYARPEHGAGADR